MRLNTTGGWVDKLPPASIITKAECPGCLLGRDPHGRYPLGFCGPRCALREAHDRGGHAVVGGILVLDDDTSAAPTALAPHPRRRLPWRRKAGSWPG